MSNPVGADHKGTATRLAFAATLILGLCLLFLPMAEGRPNDRPTLAAAKQSVPVVVSPLFVSELIDSLSVGQAGASRYVAQAAMIEGQKYERSLMTEVDPRQANGIATLTLLLGSSFDVLRATIGRDDADFARGAGGVYFEVWGDDRLLYKSGVLLSRKHPIRVGGSPLNVRLAPEEVEVPVKGVNVLRLLTRYASDVSQRGSNAGRAHGCVWGDVRLMPRAGVASLRTFDPVRDAVRTAAVQVTAAVIAARDAEPGGAAPRGPLRVGITPLHAEGEPSDETAVRAALLTLLDAARRGGSPVFAALPRRDASKLTSGLTAGDDSDAALSEAGRRVGADMIVAGTFTATKDGQVELRAVDARTGKRLATAVVALVFPGGN
jgi:hypothetical protein